MKLQDTLANRINDNPGRGWFQTRRPAILYTGVKSFFCVRASENRVARKEFIYAVPEKAKQIESAEWK
jgi:hypothetical protein